MDEKTQVLVVSDRPLSTLGLRTLIEESQDLEWAGRTSSDADVARLVEQTRPDVVVLDCYLVHTSAATLAETLQQREPAVQMLALNPVADAAHLGELLSAGVRGYLLKTESESAVLEALRAIGRGEARISPDLAALVSTFIQGKKTDPPKLTRREGEILRLLAMGKSNAEIAKELHLTAGTVKNHITRIYDKLEVTTRVEAVLWALREGVVKVS